MMRSGKAALLIISLISAVCLAGLGASSPNQQAATSRGSPRPARTEGLDAWQQVYSVLTHPRCLNCHTATDYPQQGDDRHRHLYNVVRGPQGKGVAALNCVTCHQEANADTTGCLAAPIGTWRRSPCNGRTPMTTLCPVPLCAEQLQTGRRTAASMDPVC